MRLKYAFRYKFSYGLSSCLDMKQLSVFLLAALLCSCLQRPPVEGNLSLFELEGDHYIKLELRNNTDEDLYIPHMSEYYSVFDENGVECTSIYYYYDGNPSGDFIS